MIADWHKNWLASYHMSKLFLFAAFCIFAPHCEVLAQHEYTNCKYHYNRNGKIASSVCYDRDGRWGKAKAFGIKGELIYEKEVRHVAGTASVEFSYYENGAVKAAKWYSAPDGGIQWYNTTTFFSPEGKIEREEEYNYYDKPTTHTVLTKEPLVRKTAEPETQRCGAIYVTELWFINNTNYTIRVQVSRRGIPLVDSVTLLKPGDTAKGDEFYMAEQFVDPNEYYNFSVFYCGRHKKKKSNLVFYQSTFRILEKTRKRVYYTIK